MQNSPSYTGSVNYGEKKNTFFQSTFDKTSTEGFLFKNKFHFENFPTPQNYVFLNLIQRNPNWKFFEQGQILEPFVWYKHLSDKVYNPFFSIEKEPNFAADVTVFFRVQCSAGLSQSCFISCHCRTMHCTALHSAVNSTPLQNTPIQCNFHGYSALNFNTPYYMVLNLPL